MEYIIYIYWGTLKFCGAGGLCLPHTPPFVLRATNNRQPNSKITTTTKTTTIIKTTIT